MGEYVIDKMINDLELLEQKYNNLFEIIGHNLSFQKEIEHIIYKLEYDKQKIERENRMVIEFTEICFKISTIITLIHICMLLLF